MADMRAEYNSYYRDCFMPLKSREGVLHVLEIGGPSDEGLPMDHYTFLGRMYMSDGSSHTSNVNGGQIDFTLPGFGCINIERHASVNGHVGSCFYISRVPQRQYKRGTHPRHLEMHRLGQTPDFVGVRFPRMFRNARSIYPAFFPEYSGSIKDSLEKVKNCEYISHAFSPLFWVGVHAFYHYYVLGYRNHIVGGIKADGRVFLTPEYQQLFEQINHYSPTVVEDV